MLLVLLLPLHKQKAEAAATPPKVYQYNGQHYHLDVVACRCRGGAVATCAAVLLLWLLFMLLVWCSLPPPPVHRNWHDSLILCHCPRR